MKKVINLTKYDTVIVTGNMPFEIVYDKYNKIEQFGVSLNNGVLCYGEMCSGLFSDSAREYPVCGVRFDISIFINGKHFKTIWG